MIYDPSSFDFPIDRRGTNCTKWDDMEARFGVSPDDGLAMWVADMDFRPPRAVTNALTRMTDHGVYGYYGDDSAYREAIRWWMDTRHGWSLDPAHIFSTHGLVNGAALCIDAFTAPDEAVVLFTPVYHAFFRIIKASGRGLVECPMPIENGRYVLDFDAFDAQMSGKERLLLLCSPHNPGGRVWTRAELEGVAAFAQRHDLIVVSDEIHHDLTMPDQTHIPMTLIDGIEDRLVMMTAATKTFNIAGAHTGNVIIADETLRQRFRTRMAALGLSPGSFGVEMVRAAYSPEGAAWVDALRDYINGNRAIFDAAIARIPGLNSMPLEATYLSWVDFSGTGMSEDEIDRRVGTQARIAANVGPTFGSGGALFRRFNLGTQRKNVEDAAARLLSAFSDLQ